MRWIPSHLEPAKLCNCFEDWIFFWNRRVDEIAVQGNQERDSFTLGLQDALVNKYKMQHQLERLRNFYLAVADTTFQVESAAPPDVPEPPEEDLSVAECLTECLPLSWIVQISSLTFTFGATFAINIFEKFFEWEGFPGKLSWFSHLEIVFLLADGDFSFPGDSDPHELRPFTTFFAPPPATRLLSIVSHVFDEVLATLDLAVFRRADFCKPEIWFAPRWGGDPAQSPRSAGYPGPLAGRKLRNAGW